MMEKFYCVGCKNHHELEVLEATEQNGKGGSIRYSLRSVCPSGHKTNKLCKQEIYEAYGAETGEHLECDLCESNDSSVGFVDDKNRMKVCRYCDIDGSDFNPDEWDEDILNERLYGAEALARDAKWKGVGWTPEEEATLSPEEKEAVAEQLYNDWRAGKIKATDVGEYYERLEKGAEGMTVGVNLEALAPTPDEPESGVALVPEDSLMPEGSGRTIGSQSVSHNYTPFHAEIAYAVSWEGKEDNNEGLIYGIEYIDEVGDVADVEWFSTAEERDEELTRYLEKYGAEGQKFPYEAEEPRIVALDIKMLDEKAYQEKMDNRRVAECGGGYRYRTEPHDWKSMGEQKVLISYGETPYSYNQRAHMRKTGQYKVEYTKEGLHDYSECTKCGLFVPVPLSEIHEEAETFIAYPELKDHLVAVMPDKIYGVKVMDDGDFEMKVADRYMDEVISVVSDYQMNEPSGSSGFLGSGYSKTTVAVATATLAVGLAYYFNRK